MNDKISRNNTGVRAHRALAYAVLPWMIMQCSCQSLVPQRDLQLLAKSLPPAEPIAENRFDDMAERIRRETGIASFDFATTEFEPETRLPSGTEWILGVCIGE